MTASLADPSLKGLGVYPTRHLNLSHENIVVTAPGYFGIGGRFEEQRERFNEVGPRFFVSTHPGRQCRAPGTTPQNRRPRVR